jgi:hypothetical protein
MGTEIYGSIEFRHPGVGTDYYEGEPWVAAMDLWPLYDQSDYAAFGLLFGVRNYAGFQPLAAGRGLPNDLSGTVRAQLESSVARGDMDGATWVTWAQLAGLDPALLPGRYVGRVSWSQPASGLSHGQLVPARWPDDVLATTGPPPPGWDPAHGPLDWTADNGLRCRYEPMRTDVLLGPGTGWPHVFAVMKALADRFGDDAVRLVVAFD